MKYATMKTYRNRMKQFLLLGLMVLGGAMTAMGANWAPAVNQSGTYVLETVGSGNQFKVNGSGTYDAIAGFALDGNYTITVKFKNTRTIILDGQIQVHRGTVIFKFAEGWTQQYDASNPTLKVQRRLSHIVRVGENSKSVSNGGSISDADIQNPDYCKFIIEGRAATVSETFPTTYNFTNNFVIDFGGPELTVQNPDSWTPTLKTGNTGVIHSGGGLRLRHGTIQITNVTLRRFFTNMSSQVGLLQAFAQQPDISARMIVKHCEFTQNAARNGCAVLKMQGMKPTNNAVKEVIMEDCLVYNNFDYDQEDISGSTTGGNINITNREINIPEESDFCIRSVGNSRFQCFIRNCNINHNYGGAIRWHTGSISDPLELENCLIEHNFSTVQGGGVCVKAPCTITNCTIQNNRSRKDGGGIYLTTYTEHHSAGIIYDQWAPENGILRLDPSTIVRGNITLGNGGGIAIVAALMSASPIGYQSGSPINGELSYYYYHAGASNPPGPDDQFKMQFIQNGGKVHNNIAYGNYGGGVYISRPNTCSFYKTECSLDYGEIANNKVIPYPNSGSVGGSGGGVAIVADPGYVNPPGIPDAVVPMDVIVDISEPNEKTNHMLVQNNEASQDGGGVYVSAQPVHYAHNGATSNTNTTVYDYSNIDNNSAGKDGGGLYVLQGSVRVVKEGTGNDAKSPIIQKNTAATGNGGGVYLNTGSIDMKGAIVGDTIPGTGNTAGQTNPNHSGDGGGIFVNTGTITMLSSIVSNNKAFGTEGDGGGIYVNSGDVLINHKEQSTGNPSLINSNSAQRDGGGIYDHGGKVVVFGAFDADSTYRVQISGNTTTTGNGGGIYCQGSSTTTNEYDIRMRRVKLEGNTSGNHGGGIYLYQGKVSVINGWLLNNTAGGGGGGVYTQIGNIDINITGEERQPSKINGNKAHKNGGGLNTKEGFITVRGKSKDDRIEIKNNVAGNGSDGKGSGGGAFCLGSSADMEYITMRHVDLTDNEANGGGEDTEGGNTISLGCGGGIYLQQGVITVTDVAIQNNKAEKNGGGINNHSGNIDVNGCLIGGAEGKGNQAGNSGGGIYTNQGDIDIEDYVETEGGIQRIESKITHNSAGMNGGGADTRMGTIWVNKKEMDDQIEISYNTAKNGGGLYANSGTIEVYNAHILENIATENGGGMNNHAGDIIMHGGSLTNNQAVNGHGGGAYTYVGDIDMFQFPSTKLSGVTLNDGTKVFNNVALKNGGAVNNHTGRVDMRHATIYNNTATQGNGGGIFCEGPHANDNRGLGYTIRLLYSDLIQNKTRGQDGTQAEPTGRGGGIYLKYGNIYAHHSNIHDNEANINGGGLNNHQGNILLYGCEVKGNRAVELDGGGIYTYEGNITIGPSSERVNNPSQSMTTVIEGNRAFRDGGGINNQKGNITLHGGLIASNEALNRNGGGVYIANGNITMNGGRIEENSASKGNGGGVYSGGGVFDIHERDENPDPIVLIIDTKVNRNTDANGAVIVGEGAGQNATIHYHLVDQGKYSGFVANSVKHGIVWWNAATPGTTYRVVYDETDVTSGYIYTEGEVACERITIPSVITIGSTPVTGIEPGKTYVAKAFYEYQYVDGSETITKTGYSEEMEFVTYSNDPLVVSGAVSNITSTNATGSGRIMDPGSSPITERGVKIWRDPIEGESSAPAALYIASTTTTDFFTVENLRDPANGATQLLPNQKYYACAYATNSSGTSEGNTVEFTTLKDTPNMGTKSVVVSHEIVNDSIIVTAVFEMPEGTDFDDLTAYGFVWSTDDDPELYADHTVAGTHVTGTTEFTATYRGARQGICIYVRAYATNSPDEPTALDATNYSVTGATPYYTPYSDGTPVVRAIDISDITQHSAIITCKIYHGFNYNGSTTIYGVHLENDNSYHPATTPYSAQDSTYNVALTGLTPGTTYYLKAYATNDNGAHYSYGNGYNFTALPITQPSVVVKTINYYTEPGAVHHDMVDVVYEVENDGGGSITAHGIIYGNVNSDGTIGSTIDTIPGGTLINGIDTLTITGLTPHYKYWVSAYVTNSVGTHNCQPVIFTANYDKPFVKVTSVDQIQCTFVGQNDYTLTARGNFKIAPHSAATSDNVNTYGMCWSVLHEPTRSKSAVSNTDFMDSNTPVPPISGSGTDTIACSAMMSQTHANTKYWVRAYASTATANDDPDNGIYSLADIVYTGDTSFITLPVMYTTGETATVHNGATLSGRIGSRDSEGYLMHDPANASPNGLYGVCWGASENPTRGQGGATNYVEQTINTPNANTFDFSLMATGFARNTTYHYRAYSINSVGNISYGADDTFTTRAHSVTLTSVPASAAAMNGSYENLTSNNYTVSFVPNAGYVLSTLTLDGTAVSPSYNSTTGVYTYTFDVSADHTLVATFLAQVTATANPEAGGTITGTGDYSIGATCNLVATPNTGYYFVNWTDADGNVIMNGDTPQGPSYSFTVNIPVSLTANFSNQYEVSVTAAPDEGGTVTGGGAYTYNSSATVTATANEGYTFLNWTVNGTVVSTNASYTFTVTSDITLVANFTANSYTLTLTAEPSGYGTFTVNGTAYSNPVSVTYNSPVTIEATPASGYTFVKWTLNGEEVSGNASYSFNYNIADNAELVAHFQPSGRGGGTIQHSTGQRSRDIYPAPAREPWDWDDEDPETNRENEPPTVTTGTMTDLTATSATIRGIVTSEGDATVSEVGFWWSTKGPEYNSSTNTGTFVQVTTPNPVLNTQFSKELTGLNGDATYYVRAYAKNSHGTGFGNLRAFSFNCLPTINHNTAENGGGIYIASGGKILFSSGDINLNEATVNGGGIYLEEGSIMHMRNICEVNGNHTPDFNLIPASNATDKDTIVGGGAGIYLDGKLYVGENIDDPKGTHRLYVNKNYAMTSFTEAKYDLGNYDNQYYLRNNVFLPYPTNKTNENYFDAYNDFDHHDNNKARVIVLLSDISNAENTAYSHIGFSVTKGKIPVVATAKKAEGSFNFTDYGIYTYGPTGNVDSTETWMNTITDRMNSAHSANASVFDDARAYIAIHARQDDSPFREDYIYLWDCWTTPVVKYDPALYDMYGHRLTDSNGNGITDDSHYTVDGNGLWHIKDEKGLAWFSANVNRLNGSNNANYSTLEAVLEADLDMTEYLWVPIASVRERQTGINTIFRDIDDSDPNIEKLGFRGKFNGQGHLITGIDCRYISGMEKYGLFGNLEDGAVVENTFVDASRFRTNDQSKSYHVGGIAGLMEEGSTVRASEARFVVDLARANKATSYVGGLAGQVKGTNDKPAIIHSSMAMPEIKGTVRYIGGLVGQLGANCDLLNSFSNPKFPDISYDNSDTIWTSCTYIEETQTWVPSSPEAIEASVIYFGGLVGVNNGLVENCYSRLQGNEPKNSSNQSIFGWLAGTNTKEATETSQVGIRYCYAPTNKTVYVKNQTEGSNKEPFKHGNYSETERYSDKYGFKHRDHKMYNPGSEGTIINSNYSKFIDAKTNDTLVGGLMNALNHWVDTANKTTMTYYRWTRTMASHINDDYPVPMLIYKNDEETFNCVGSKDEIYLLYEDNINDMWTAKKFDTITKKTPRAAMYLYDVQPGDVPADVKITGNVNVPLHIHEDIGITQPADAVLTARAGVTIKNARKGNNDFTTDPNWHLFSSAINGVPVGLDYHTASETSYVSTIVNQTSHPENIWGNRNYFDPPRTTWFQSDDDSEGKSYAPTQIGYFPTNTPYGTWRPGLSGGHTSSEDDGFFDLYEYSEIFYHWINFKREGTNTYQDHWHWDKDLLDGEHYKIEAYRNDVTMPAGKGYLMALSSESMMMADGTLNNGDNITRSVTSTPIGTNLPPHGHGSNAYDAPWRTLNMIGNPYQSYLDFYEFVFNTEANNKNLLYSVNGYYCYALRDDKNKENPYVYYTTMQSDNPEYSASRFIHPHQGFFVKVNGSGNIKFNNTMRSAISYNSTFREEHLNYPLVNLLCYDSQGKRDLTTVELKRPDQGGGLKMTNLNAGDGLIGAYMDGETYQTLFTPEGINIVPVHFKALEDGIFTLRWNTLHGDFTYLHLIDNLTGADVDCLTTDEYIFEGKSTDYKTRFKLIFECTGVEENDDENVLDHFAFFFGSELMVNGEGTLQMFDINGRCLMTSQLEGVQNSINLPRVAAGIYLLRLIGDKQTRIQKIVIK